MNSQNRTNPSAFAMGYLTELLHVLQEFYSDSGWDLFSMVTKFEISTFGGTEGTEYVTFQHEDCPLLTLGVYCRQGASRPSYMLEGPEPSENLGYKSFEHACIGFFSALWLREQILRRV